MDRGSGSEKNDGVGLEIYQKLQDITNKFPEKKYLGTAYQKFVVDELAGEGHEAMQFMIDTGKVPFLFSSMVDPKIQSMITLCPQALNIYPLLFSTILKKHIQDLRENLNKLLNDCGTLPEPEWESVTDENSGKIYYWNRTTDETTVLGSPKPADTQSEHERLIKNKAKEFLQQKLKEEGKNMYLPKN